MTVRKAFHSQDLPIEMCRWHGQHQGFTLIELIMVILVMGVLAVVAAPRVFNTSDVNARGFHDETLALLRYAQKSAIAQRRTVCVSFSLPAPASATLAIASQAAVGNCDMALAGPNQNCTTGPPSGAKGCTIGKGSVYYSSGPASLRFDGLGQAQAYDASGIALTALPQIQVADAVKAIQVEAATGYIHESP